MNQKKSTKILIILIIVVLITILFGGFVFAYLATDIFRSEKDLFFKYITQIGDSENGFIENQLKEYFEKRKNTSYKDEGRFFLNITSPTNQEEFENINNFNITYSGQVDKTNSKAEQNISLNYSDEVNFPISYKQIENTTGLQTKYVGSKYIAVETDNLENLSNMGDIPLNMDMSNLKNASQVELTKEQKTYIKNTYMGVLNNHLREEKFSKVEEAKETGYKLSLTGGEIKNILIQLLETLKNDQSTIDIINQLLETQEDSKKLAVDNIDDLIEEINDEDFDIENIEITVYSKNGQTNKIKISTSEGSFNIEKFKENNTLKILFYYESTKEPSPGRLFTIMMSFEGLDSMQNIKEIYELEIKFGQQSSILEQAQKASSQNQLMYEKERIGLLVNEAIAESVVNTRSTSSAITKENLEKIIENDNLYANIKIENVSEGNIQIEFTDTGDIFIINNKGQVIGTPEENTNEDNNSVDSSQSYKYQLENNISFTDTVNIEEFTSNNSMILTDYDSEQVSNFLSAVGERLEQVNKQQMEELGLEEDENPIRYLIPSIGLISKANEIMNEKEMSEEQINIFNSKFENYEGTNQQAQTVKGLLSTILRNNGDEENDDMKITEINFNGQEYEATEENISSIKDNINMEKNYRIEFEKDSDTGLIFRIVINEK